MSSEGDATSAPPKLTEVKESLDESSQPKSLAEKHEQERRSRTWPKRNLAQIAQHDPFSLTGELRARSTKAIVAQFAQGVSPETANERPTLKNPVQAIIHGPKGAAAIVENRIVRVGDFVEPGVRVVAIEHNAIVVQIVNQLPETRAE
jgi:hypothetical protein